MSPRPLASPVVSGALLAALLGATLAVPFAASAEDQDGPVRRPDGGPAERVVMRSDPAPATAYELPFPCGQSWTGTTRSSHSPSPKAVDWNRPDDLGDDVVAAATGTVVTATKATSSGYGNYVVIDHGHDESTLYAHLSKISVTEGQRVDQGALIGLLGESGNVTGPHLHFEERMDGKDRTAYFHGVDFAYNTTLTSQNCPDVPLAGNLLSTTSAELVMFRRANPASFRVKRAGQDDRVFRFGAVTDEPVLGDWDGNGLANPGVWTPASRLFKLRAGGKITQIRFGAAGAIPVAGDWDGDGRWDVGVRRAGTNKFRVRFAADHVVAVPLGDADDLPVTGDWDGDGRTDLGVYDQATATYTLRYVDAEDTVWVARVRYGDAGDLPVTGDWDDNGRTDLGTWDPRTAVFSQRRASSVQSTDVRTRSAVVGRPRA